MLTKLLKYTLLTLKFKKVYILTRHSKGREVFIVITVYTKYGCPKCDMTKKVLDGENISYTSINIEDNADAMSYVKDELGFMSMPVVVAEGKEPFNDFKPEILQNLKEKN
jgi:glutaredoxin